LRYSFGIAALALDGVIKRCREIERVRKKMEEEWKEEGESTVDAGLAVAVWRGGEWSRGNSNRMNMRIEDINYMRESSMWTATVH
jgi:hypothetical protein